MTSTEHCQIDHGRLDKAHYFHTLLQEAQRVDIISTAQAQQMQTDCMSLLATLANEYTRGRSSSIRNDTAERLMLSAMYTLGVVLICMPSPDAAANALIAQPVSGLYTLGKTAIERKISQAARTYSQLKARALQLKNILYNDTLFEGIPLFFEKYDSAYSAHDTPASIDYPLSRRLERQSGIQYISEYLQCLTHETAFCSHFCDIDALLSGYHAGFEDLLINIFDIVLACALGCTLLGKPAPYIQMTPNDQEALARLLSPMSARQIKQALIKAATALCTDLDIRSVSLQLYIRSAVVRLCGRLNIAIHTQRIDTIFVCAKPASMHHTHFQDCPKMSDPHFRALTNELHLCATARDKAGIIAQDIHSFTDLTDVLGASCIWTNEFAAIFNTLSDSILALLSYTVPKHGDTAHYTEAELAWHQAYRSFECTMDARRKRRVLTIAQSLQPTGI